MVYTLRNKEFRLIFLVVIAVSLFFSILLCIYNYRVWNGFNKEMIDRNVAVIGNMVSSHPELEKEIVSAFTREMRENDFKKGADIAKQYGYTGDLPFSITPLMKGAYNREMIGILLAFGLQPAFILLIIHTAFLIIYRRLRELSLGAEKIMRGNFSIRFPEGGEGELPKIGFHFNQMAKRLQMTLEELKTEKLLLKNMLSDISHQLKTPLASLKMFNELLLDERKSEPGIQKEFLQKSMSQIERMEWLIYTLLKLSRLEAGVIEFNKTKDDIGNTLRDVLNSLEIKRQEKYQKVELDLVKSTYLLHDKKWLGEAFQNIIKNAMDYTPSGGAILIGLEEQESTLSVTVRDTGVGIPKEEIPNVFKRFYRGERTKGMTAKGSGIGLALAKLIIEKHEGFIDVQSEVGQGTIFTITFPKSRANITKM
ncbi:MAG: HAMP domain-containing histidine kinase [Clostridia bacterium]|nr:HAMP domain-containing histidine kinase [Clostridia bacterium]